jgi:hypothetical protein
MTILITLNTVTLLTEILLITDVTYKMTLLITVNKNTCNVAFIKVISKVIISKVFLSTVIVSYKPWHYKRWPIINQ